MGRLENHVDDCADAALRAVSVDNYICHRLRKFLSPIDGLQRLLKSLLAASWSHTISPNVSSPSPASGQCCWEALWFNAPKYNSPV
jgi:hypothetical protein